MSRVRGRVPSRGSLLKGFILEASGMVMEVGGRATRANHRASSRANSREDNRASRAKVGVVTANRAEAIRDRGEETSSGNVILVARLVIRNRSVPIRTESLGSRVLTRSPRDLFFPLPYQYQLQFQLCPQFRCNRGSCSMDVFITSTSPQFRRHHP